MLQHLTNVITGQNAAWNDAFGDRFVTLQNKNNRLINRVDKDPVSLAFGNSEIGISPRHQGAVLTSKRVLALTRLSLLTSADILMPIILGGKYAPLLKVKIRSISPKVSDELIGNTCAGLIVATTAPETHTLYRNLMIQTLCHITSNSRQIYDFVNTLKQQPIDKYFLTISDNILTQLSCRDDIASLAGVETFIGEMAVSFRTTFVDSLITSDDEKLDELLTIR